MSQQLRNSTNSKKFGSLLKVTVPRVLEDAVTFLRESKTAGIAEQVEAAVEKVSKVNIVAISACKLFSAISKPGCAFFPRPELF